MTEYAEAEDFNDDDVCVQPCNSVCASTHGLEAPARTAGSAYAHDHMLTMTCSRAMILLLTRRADHMPTTTCSRSHAHDYMLL